MARISKDLNVKAETYFRPTFTEEEMEVLRKMHDDMDQDDPDFSHEIREGIRVLWTIVSPYKVWKANQNLGS